MVALPLTEKETGITLLFPLNILVFSILQTYDGFFFLILFLLKWLIQVVLELWLLLLAPSHPIQPFIGTLRKSIKFLLIFEHYLYQYFFSKASKT